jgi:hypothetical protein
MNKSEFTHRAKLDFNAITEEEWLAINTVYTWHPMISDVNGKKEIAALYNRGGIGIIKNMLLTALELETHYSNLQAYLVERENLQEVQAEEKERMERRHANEKQDIRIKNLKSNDRIREIENSFKLRV